MSSITSSPFFGRAKHVNSRYVGISLLSILACFVATLIIPYWYDRSNAKDFTDAEKSGNLVIREYGELIVAADLSQQQSEAARENRTRKSAVDLLKDKRIISLDYIQQMHRAGQVAKFEFLLFSGVISFVLLLLVGLVLHAVKRYSIRTPALVFVFLGSLMMLQAFGLPHTNQKFHVMVGLFYAGIFALSDFLQTLDLELEIGRPKPDDKDGWPGYLSSLQYKHRFWTVIFNLCAVAVITLLATVSFKILDVFLIIFGESFVKSPLVGLMLATTIGLLWAFFGVFRPIRRHIAAIEGAMKREP